MPGNDQVQDPSLRDALGHTPVFAEGSEPSAKAKEGSLETYSIIKYGGLFLPQEYRGMIFSKWLRSLRFGNDFYKLIDPDAYYSTYSRYISTTMAKPDTVVRLAVLTKDKDVALGFAVHRRNVLDYVHVHKDQRKHGIGTSLLPEGIDTFTHVTNMGLTIWGSKYGKWKFNPFA